MKGGNNSNMQPCVQCAGLSFSEDDQGFLECNICHTRVEGYFTQEVDTYEGGYRLNEFKRVVTQETLDSLEKQQLLTKENRYYTLQSLLKEQVKALISGSLNVNTQLYQISGDIWFRFLEKLQTEVNSSWEKKNQPSPYICLSICYLACCWLKEPLILADFIRFIQQSTIPMSIESLTWERQPKSPFGLLNKTVFNISKYLTFRPKPNIPLLLLRFCTELQLPKFILNHSKQLYKIISIPLTQTNQTNSFLSYKLEKLLSPNNYDLLCTSLIIITLKMNYTLFGNIVEMDEKDKEEDEEDDDEDDEEDDEDDDEEEEEEEEKNSKKGRKENIDKQEQQENNLSNQDYNIFDIQEWLYNIIVKLPKSKFISKNSIWDLNADDFQKFPKSRISSYRRYHISEGLYQRFESVYKKFDKPHPLDIIYNHNNSSNNDSGSNSNSNNRKEIQEKDNVQEIKNVLNSKRKRQDKNNDNDDDQEKKELEKMKYQLQQTKGDVNGIDYINWIVRIFEYLIYRKSLEINQFVKQIEKIYIKMENQIIDIKDTDDSDNDDDSDSNKKSKITYSINPNNFKKII